MKSSLHRVLLLAVLASSGGTALARDLKDRLLQEPPPLLPDKIQEKEGLKSTGAPKPEECTVHECKYTLPISMKKGVIFNPATGKDDRVMLRSYGDRFIAPTITMWPGQTVRVTLENDLRGSDCVPDKDLNTPKCFDSTNLHAHGLWISPSGNSDNVLLTINPTVKFEYEYNVPEDHPAGTFWYHPHVHGATAVQVGSGMAGALIVKGDRKPTLDRNGEIDRPGDIDTLLKSFEPKSELGKKDYSEVMLFQQIPYACFNGPDIKTKSDLKDPEKRRWDCEQGDVGEIKDFKNQFGPRTWGQSGRYTSINGVVQPRLEMEAGRIYRWRLIDAGLREAIRLRISKLVPTPELDKDTVPPDREQAYIKEHCSRDAKDEVEQWEIATDGLTHDKIVRKSVNDLQPGYRSDVLLVFPSEGEYCVVDEPSDPSETVSAAPENARLLATVSVKGGKPVLTDVKRFLATKLREEAGKKENGFPEDVQKKIVGDLKDDPKDDLKLSSFVPHKPITKTDVKGRTQHLFFNIFPLKDSPLENKPKPVFRIGDSGAQGNENWEYRDLGLPYSPNRIDRTLVLGTAEEWVLTSDVAGHPFHIHVNPFQIVSITWKDDKKDGEGKVIEERKGKPVDDTDTNYAGMIGTWKDTLFVRSDVEIRVRTRYERYIGDFVLHCHILDHEDQGMMQNVRISLPDGKGGAMPFGHVH
jgi:L-ascorbate oxidase